MHLGYHLMSAQSFRTTHSSCCFISPQLEQFLFYIGMKLRSAEAFLPIYVSFESFCVIQVFLIRLDWLQIRQKTFLEYLILFKKCCLEAKRHYLHCEVIQMPCFLQQPYMEGVHFSVYHDNLNRWPGLHTNPVLPVLHSIFLSPRAHSCFSRFHALDFHMAQRIWLRMFFQHHKQFISGMIETEILLGQHTSFLLPSCAEPRLKVASSGNFSI